MGNIIKPAMIFGSRMVLQRRKPVRIWGTCTEELPLTVRIGETSTEAYPGNGRWEALLPPMEACEGAELVISCDKETIRFTDVSIGEVWLAAGQSNMEFYLRYDTGRSSAKENPHIHMFDYPEVAFEGQLEKGEYSDYGFWRTCTEENLDYFSAAAYYFAMRIYEKYQIPIGIVGCNWGGTPACAWLDPEYLKNTAGEVWLRDYETALEGLDLQAYEEAYEKDPSHYRQKPFEDRLNEALMYGVSQEEFMKIIQEMIDRENAALLPMGPRSERRPGGLYSTMVRKTAPFSVRGVLWYQGESDDLHPEAYDVVLEKLIRCWRDLWQEELPFLIVQLAAFRYWDPSKKDCFPMIRRAQDQVSSRVPGVWMASIMDTGLENDLHPKQKRPVGERLALLAMGHVYGENILCDPPECAEMKVQPGKIILAFAHAGNGLYIAGDNLTALEVDIDGVPIEDIQAEVSGNRLILRSDRLTPERMVRVAFAETDFCKVNLYSSADLPAKPFTRISDGA